MKRLAARKIMVRKADEPSSWPFKLLLNLVSLESKGLLTRIQKFEACWNGVAKHYYYHKWNSECFESSWTATYRTYCSFWNSPDYSYDVEWHFNNNLRKHYSVQLSSVSSAAKPMTILIQEIRPHLPDHLPTWLSSRVSARHFTRWGCERCRTSKLSHRGQLSAKNGNPKCSSTGCLKCMQSLSQLLLCPIVEHLLVNTFTRKKTS